MLQQQGLCGDGADATRAEEFGESDQQVDGEDDEFAHGAHRTMTTSVHKTAPHSRIPSYYEFATYLYQPKLVGRAGQRPADSGGIRNIAVHKGLPFGPESYAHSTCVDVGRVARRYPDVNFL